MNSSQYTIVAYCIALGLMLGYAFYLWAQSRVLARKETRSNGGRS